jgi:FSR family fosmidomycin resistance protein-like MFS transporter
MSMIGVVGYLGLDATGSYVVILALVGLAGFGSSAYHPQASAMVPRISGNRKGMGVSIFSAGGNLGYAIMPLLVVPVTALWGITGVLVLMVPGILMAFVLQRYAPEAPASAVQPKISEIWADVKVAARPLSVVIGIVCMRAWLFFGLITFLASYMVNVQGQSHEVASGFLSVLLLFGAAGTLIGGNASDIYGRKFVIAMSLLLTGPLLFLALSTGGILELVLLALAGVALLASFSPAVLIAQSLIPKNQGVASGIVLGFAIGIGGLGVSVTGYLMDTFGATVGVYSLVALPVIGLLLTFLLPGKLLPEKVEAKKA